MPDQEDVSPQEQRKIDAETEAKTVAALSDSDAKKALAYSQSEALKLAALNAVAARTLLVGRQVKQRYLWEVTQAYIAALAITVSYGIMGYLLIRYADSPIAQGAILFITNTASLIIGNYFNRVNPAADVPVREEPVIKT